MKSASSVCIGRYTFRMLKALLWLVVIASAAGIAMWLWRAQRRIVERREAEEARMASFIAQTVPRAAAIAAPEEKLLFDAAAKAGEAGEPALSIQLYARLIARYPQSALATQARGAVEVHKKKLSMARSPGTAVPD